MGKVGLEQSEEAFEPAEKLPERFSRYLHLADIALVNAAREEQRRIKETIRPSVENYRELTGRKR